MRTTLTAAILSAAALSSPFLFAIPAGASPDAVQPATGAADAPLAQDPRHVVGELASGMRYLIVKHSNPPDRGLVWLHVNTGSLNETPKQRGAARMLQRLAFAGSKNFVGQQGVANLLQAIGSQPNVDALSHSTFEETVFKLALRQATNDAMDKALSFLADVPYELSLPDAEIERERGILIDQIKVLSTPENRVQDKIWKQIAPGSQFGERVPDAPESAFTALSKDELLAYYKQWYTPSNMTLIIAADMDPQVVLEMVKTRFDKLEKKPRPTTADVGVKPYQKSFGILAIEPEMKGTQLYMFRLAPAHPPTKMESQLREKLVQSLAIGAFNRRLSDKIAAGKVKFVGGSALAVDLANISTLVAVNASSEVADWKQTLASLATEVQRVRLHGLTESDIDAVKKQYAQAAEQGVKQETTKVLGTLIAGIAQSVNNGDVYMSSEQTLAMVNRLVPSITKAELDATVKTLFDPTTAAFVMAGPGGPGTPTEEELLKAGAEAFAVTPSAEVEAAKPTALMTKLPTPGKVTSEKTHEKTGVQTWTLDNGAVVHFLNLTTKKDLVNITVNLTGGLIEETPANHGITEAASVVMARPATTTLTSGMIRELLQGKSVDVRGSSGVDALLIGVSGKPADIESGMQVANLMLTDPFIEPPGFDQWRRDSLDEARDGNKKPQFVFNTAVHDAMFPESEFRLRGLTEKEVNAITIESATSWFKQVIAKAPIEVSIVGDISKEEAIRLATTYVGSLPKRGEPTASLFKEAHDVKRPTGQRTVEREVDSPMQTAYLMLGFYAADEAAASDRRALFISRAILEPRLVRSLRDQEQLVSTIQVRFDPGQEFKGYGMFRALAPVAPEKVDVLVKRVEETFKSYADAGPTPEELEGVRQQALQSLEEVQKDPNYWTGELSMLISRGKSLDDASGERAAYEKVTAADVKAVFNKYYGTGTTLRVVLKPKAAEPIVPPLPGGGK